MVEYEKDFIFNIMFNLCFSFTACNSADKGYHVDDKTGNIIDAETGDIVSDHNLAVGKDTGNIVDKETGEALHTKNESDKIK